MSAPQVDLTENRGRNMHNLSVAMIILSSVSFALRVWSRYVSSAKNRFWWDDWLAFAAWCCCVCDGSFAIKGIQLGLGKHFAAYTSKAEVTELLRLIYIAEIFFSAGLFFAKLSALFFYRRVFAKRCRWFNIAFWVTLVYLVVFGLYTTPLLIFVCYPPKKFWLPETPGRCFGVYSNFTILIIGLFLDVSTDLIILILPIPVILGLKLATGRKIGLVVAFTCGYAAWTASIGRMATYIATQPHLRDPDLSWYDMPNIEWSMAEIGISVFSICIPTWIYLLRAVKDGEWRKLFTSQEERAYLPRYKHSSSEQSTLSIIPENRIIRERTFAITFQNVDSDQADQ